MIFEMSSTIEGRPQHTAGESDKQHFMRIEKHEAPLHCMISKVIVIVSVFAEAQRIPVMSDIKLLRNKFIRKSLFEK